MISFRYHVVSLVAVLFALGVGVLLGGNVLSSGTSAAASVQVVDLQAETALLRERVEGMESTLAFADAFGQQTQDAQVADALTGRSAVVVALPGAEAATVAATRETLVAAGSTVTGTLTVEPAWTDAASDSVLDSLAAQLVTDGATLPDTDGYDRGALVLAASLVEPEGSEQADTIVETTPSAYAESGLVSLPEPIGQPAQLAVLVAGTGVEDDGEAGRRLDALTSLAAAFDAQGAGAVLAGPPEAAGPLGVIDAVRADTELSGATSTVDMAHVSSGRTVIALALAEQAAGGVGHYGAVGEVDGPLPPPR